MMSDSIKIDKKVLVRDYKQHTDSNFIRNSFMNSAFPSFKPTTKEAFNKVILSKFCNHLHNQSCLVACNPEHPDQIFGYIVFKKGSQNIIYWIYVKEHFRRFGIANLLFKSAYGEQDNYIIYFPIKSHRRIFKHLSKKENLTLHNDVLCLEVE